MIPVKKQLKSETISGRRVDFYQLDGIVGAKVEGLQPNGGRQYFSGAKTKEELVKRLPMMIRRREENDKSDRIFNDSLKFKFPKLRRFYFSTESRRASYGTNVTATVYEQTDTGMKELGQTKWNTGSFKGEESTVLDFLKNKEIVPKGMFPSGYYSWSEAEKYNIQIRGL